MANLVTMVDNIREPNVRRQLMLFGVIGLVVALILGELYFAFLRVSYRAIFQDLREADAATIVADLEKRKVPYRLENEGKTILVPAKIANSVRLAEVSADLPLKGMVGFELFNKSDIGLTEFAQKSTTGAPCRESFRARSCRLKRSSTPGCTLPCRTPRFSAMTGNRPRRQ